MNTQEVCNHSLKTKQLATHWACFFWWNSARVSLRRSRTKASLATSRTNLWHSNWLVSHRDQTLRVKTQGLMLLRETRNKDCRPYSSGLNTVKTRRQVLKWQWILKTTFCHHKESDLQSEATRPMTNAAEITLSLLLFEHLVMSFSKLFLTHWVYLLIESLLHH